MRKLHLLARALVKSNAIRLVDTMWGPTRLTVLVYHRVNNLKPDVEYYTHNISTSPELFAQHMDYVAAHFNVIDLAALEAFLLHDKALPPYPLLITFDDGYLDNYQHAYPVLKAHGFPAVIFVITERMSNPGPEWWDECAFYFKHTAKQRAWLPLIGECNLSTPQQRASICETLIRRLKWVTEMRKQEAMIEIQQALDVTLPSNIEPLFITWRQVKELVANGIACQPHTVTHPILTRVSESEMRHQLMESAVQVAAQTGQPIRAFAYPNGQPQDYNEATIRALWATGYHMAFTHSEGPMHLADVRHQPYEISRIAIQHTDSFEMFMMKVTGLVLSQRQHRPMSKGA